MERQDVWFLVKLRQNIHAELPDSNAWVCVAASNAFRRCTRLATFDTPMTPALL